MINERLKYNIVDACIYITIILIAGVSASGIFWSYIQRGTSIQDSVFIAGLFSSALTLFVSSLRFKKREVIKNGRNTKK